MIEEIPITPHRVFGSDGTLINLQELLINQINPDTIERTSTQEKKVTLFSILSNRYWILDKRSSNESSGWMVLELKIESFFFSDSSTASSKDLEYRALHSGQFFVTAILNSSPHSEQSTI